MSVVSTRHLVRPLRSARFRGILAAVAVVGFFGTLVVAPFAMTNASADETFYDRIHQEFSPELAEEQVIDVSISPLEEIEKEPVVPAPSVTATHSAPPRYTGGGSPAEWMAAAGIPEADWGYVDAIVTRESGWNPNATNASSGACGLVQALPCSKVPGNGYDPVDNLRWGAGYASGRYGSWAKAYTFWQNNHWW